MARWIKRLRRAIKMALTAMNEDGANRLSATITGTPSAVPGQCTAHRAAGHKVAHPSRAEDDFSRAVKEFRAKAMAIASRMEKEAKEAIAVDEALIAKALQFIKETGIGHSLCLVQDKVQHYPTWSQRADWTKWNVLEVVDVTGGSREHRENSRDRAEWVLFRWHGHEWKVVHTTSSFFMSGMDCTLGDQELWIDGTLVFAQGVSRGFEEFDTWRPADTKALVVGDGSWVTGLVEMDHAFQAKERAGVVKRQSDRIKEVASKIKL